MTLLQQAEKLLITMTPAEKTQLLQWVVRDIGGAFPGIESTPGVCGGNPCINLKSKYALEFLFGC